jgi:hypothetical protein
MDKKLLFLDRYTRLDRDNGKQEKTPTEHQLLGVFSFVKLPSNEGSGDGESLVSVESGVLK